MPVGCCDFPRTERGRSGPLESLPGAGPQEICPKRLRFALRQNNRTGDCRHLPLRINLKPDVRQEGPGFVLAAIAFFLLAAGCSKSQPISVLGDASHPTPWGFY